MICPSCGEERDPIGTAIAPPLAVCPACERSLVLTDGGARLAAAADTAPLTPDQLLALKKLRKETRAERAAYFAAHH
jgi:hypothetical protein